MPEKIVQLNEKVIKGQLKELVRGGCRFVKHIGQQTQKEKANQGVS